MTRSEKLRERREERERRGAKIRAHVDALMEAKAREEEIRQRRAAIRVVGGTDHQEQPA